MNSAEVALKKGDAFKISYLSINELIIKCTTIFGDVNGGIVVTRCDPLQEFAATPGHYGPLHGSLWPVGRNTQVHILIFTQAAIAVHAARFAALGGIRGVHGGVMVEAKKIGRTLDQFLFGGAKTGQSFAESLTHTGRVITFINRIGKPGQEKLQGTFGCCMICWTFGQRFAPVAIVGDANFALLLALVCFAVHIYRFGVGFEEVVSGEVRKVFGLNAWGKYAVAVTQDGHYPGFVDGDPVFDPVTKMLETQIGVRCKSIADAFAQPAVQFKLQRRWQIPVVQGYPRLNACQEQFINERVVKIKPRLIDCATSGGQYPRPGDGKTVGLEAQLFH